jgi:hypothetical protein
MEKEILKRSLGEGNNSVRSPMLGVQNKTPRTNCAGCFILNVLGNDNDAVFITG